MLCLGFGHLAGFVSLLAFVFQSNIRINATRKALFLPVEFDHTPNNAPTKGRISIPQLGQLWTKKRPEPLLHLGFWPSSDYLELLFGAWAGIEQDANALKQEAFRIPTNQVTVKVTAQVDC